MTRWRADTESMEGLLTLATALLQRHPYLPVENVAYRRNFVELLRQAGHWLARLGDAAAAPDIEDAPVHALRFTTDDATEYDAAKLTRLRDELNKSLSALAARLVELPPLPEAVRALYTATAQAGDGGQALRQGWLALARIAPIAFNADGDPVGSWEMVRSRAMTLSPPQLEECFGDLLPMHLAGMLTQLSEARGYGGLYQALQNVLRQFVPKMVVPAVTRYSTDGKRAVTTRAISLEPVPSLFSPLRGALAGDCSMISVPFYGLLAGTRTFWIGKPDRGDDKPCGYVFVAEAECDGERLPYIMTINGVTLTAADVEAVIRAVGRIFSTSTLLLADLVRNRGWVNTQAIHAGYAVFEGAAAVVTLPRGWQQVDHETGSHFGKPYLHTFACHARRIVLPSWDSLVDFASAPLAARYPRPSSLTAGDVFARASVAANVRSVVPRDQAAKALELLGLELADFDLARRMLDESEQRLLKADDLLAAHAKFGFGLSLLDRLPLDVGVRLAQDLLTHPLNPFTAPQWAHAVARLNGAIDRLLTSEEPHRRQELCDLKAALPAELVPNYWSVIEPFLFFPSGHPDPTMCRRLVKNFRGKSVITEFLDFLSRHAGVLEAINVDDTRWVGFFQRAVATQDDQELARRLVDVTYRDYLLLRTTDDRPGHLADAVLSYEAIIGQRCEGLRQQVEVRYLTGGLAEEFRQRLREGEAAA